MIKKTSKIKKNSYRARHQGQEEWGRECYIDMLPQMFRRIAQLETGLSALRKQVSEISCTGMSARRSAQGSPCPSSQPPRQGGSNRSLNYLSPQAKIERSLVYLSDALREIDTWAMQDVSSQL